MHMELKIVEKHLAKYNLTAFAEVCLKNNW